MSLVTGNPEYDFFEQNPFFKYKKEFLDVLKHDPKNASKIMWAIAMIEDLSNWNVLRNLSRDERVEEVKSTYYDLDLDKYAPTLEAFVKMGIIREQAIYKIQIEKLDDLSQHLKKLQLTDDAEFKKVIDILSKVGKMWDSLEKVRVRFIDAQDKGTVRGQLKESFREKRNRN